MAANVRKVFAIVLLLVALVSIFVPVVSAESQTWYIYPTKTGDPPYRHLDKTAPAYSELGIADNVEKDWNGGPAECDLTLGEGTWTLDLYYTAPADGGDIDVSVARYDGSNSYTIASVTGYHLGGGSGSASVSMTNGVNRDFDAGDWLVLFIRWHEGSTAGDLTVKGGDGYSTLTGPPSDPGFPVPELSSLALFSVGLLALVGYGAYRRRDI